MERVEEAQTFSVTVYDDVGSYYLQYIMISSSDITADMEELSTVYSLLIIKTEGPEEPERIFVYDIARSYDRAYEILTILKNNTVTPCTVKEVLDDIL